MKTSYRKFKVSERVILSISSTHDGKYIDKGTEITIKSFPCCITIDPNFKNFIMGITDNNDIVRVFPNEVCKIRQKGCTIDKIITNVDCKYGAPMGRCDVGEKPSDKKIYDCKVPLSSGYDKGGCYFGFGKELRVSYTKDLSYIKFYRKCNEI